MSWGRVAMSFQTFVAHGFLFSFTLLLSLKLDHSVPYSWWKIFAPLWLFHVVTSRGRFSLPAPAFPHDRHWAPSHAVLATPLLVAFELLLCIHLDSSYVVNLKIVFLPLLAFEIVILTDNIRMCRALMPGEEENMSDEAIWETLPHFWISISMVFLIAATVFTILKLCGDVEALRWWDLFINYGIAECFAFLVCTKWHNPAIHRHSSSSSSSTHSMANRYVEWNRGSVGPSNDDQSTGICNLQDIGGHIMKIPFVCFQIILFMHLEGTPAVARKIRYVVIFWPLLMLQGVGMLFAAYKFVEKIVLGPSIRFSTLSGVHDILGFLRHGSRLLGWWRIDEGSREEQARLFYNGGLSYNTFSPDSVRKTPKSELVDEIWRLQAALNEQTEITKFRQREYERLQNDKILCRICFDEQINMVLLPCRHHVLCSTCCEKCKKCPICRVVIEEPLPVYDV